tara:strand:- start:13 stop:684 length:672 start_codon:yes stop_codon:yes gene_type:complete
MKLILNSLFLIFLFLCGSCFSQNIDKSYTIKVSGFTIGKAHWKTSMDETNYINHIKIESGGVLSILYNFSGEYFSEGRVGSNGLIPTKYTHYWKTKKIVKKMNLIFKKNKLTNLEQKPLEKERIRIDVFDIVGPKDPLTSFLQIVMGKKESLVVDGRRLYTMVSSFNSKENRSLVEITNYSNLWADHKRNKFEKIVFEKRQGEFLPFTIIIYFDGRVFKLQEN